ncbi:unnamed protein product, partial [Ectocarpus sp. 8 AP-2014]
PAPVPRPPPSSELPQQPWRHWNLSTCARPSGARGQAPRGEAAPLRPPRPPPRPCQRRSLLPPVRHGGNRRTTTCCNARTRRLWPRRWLPRTRCR